MSNINDFEGESIPLAKSITVNYQSKAFIKVNGSKNNTYLYDQITPRSCLSRDVITHLDYYDTLLQVLIYSMV